MPLYYISRYLPPFPSLHSHPTHPPHWTTGFAHYHCKFTFLPHLGIYVTFKSSYDYFLNLSVFSSSGLFAGSLFPRGHLNWVISPDLKSRCWLIGGFFLEGRRIVIVLNGGFTADYSAAPVQFHVPSNFISLGTVIDDSLTPNLTLSISQPTFITTPYIFG